MKTSETTTDMRKAINRDSGIAVDIADNEKTTEKSVDSYTKDLNNNHAGDSDFDSDAV